MWAFKIVNFLTTGSLPARPRAECLYATSLKQKRKTLPASTWFLMSIKCRTLMHPCLFHSFWHLMMLKWWLYLEKLKYLEEELMLLAEGKTCYCTLNVLNGSFLCSRGEKFPFFYWMKKFKCQFIEPVLCNDYFRLSYMNTVGVAVAL